MLEFLKENKVAAAVVAGLVAAAAVYTGVVDISVILNLFGVGSTQ